MRLATAICLVLGAAALSGCGSFRLFNDYKTAESEGVADAPWPRLVDVPEAPPPGAYSRAVPDPATGRQVQSELATRTARAGSRRAQSTRPVLAPEEREALGARAPERLQATRRPVLTPEEREILTGRR